MELVVVVVLGGLTAYLKSRGDVIDKAKDAIDKAEAEFKDSTKAGGRKFDWAVTWLYEQVPAPLNLILTKETIGGIVQRAFDTMENYAKQQLDKLAEKIVDDGK